MQGKSKEAFSKAVLKAPFVLGYSLENRIQPRMDKLLAGGVDPGKITVALPFKEEAFEEWLKARVADAKQNRNGADKEDQDTQEQESFEGEEKEPEVLIPIDFSPFVVSCKEIGIIREWKESIQDGGV